MRRHASQLAALAAATLISGLAWLGPAAPAASAASPNCSPVQISSPSRLHVKVYVGGCYWDDVALGDSMNIKITLTGPGYSKVLAAYRYGLFPGGPMAAQPAYSKSGSIAVPRAGTYTVTVVESYDYIVVPERATSRRSATVQGPAPTPTPKPTPRPTPRPTPKPTPRPTPSAATTEAPATPTPSPAAASGSASPSPSAAPAATLPASSSSAAGTQPSSASAVAPDPGQESAASVTSWLPVGLAAAAILAAGVGLVVLRRPGRRG